MRVNKIGFVVVFVLYLIIAGVWFLTFMDGQRLLNRQDSREEVVYDGNTEDRPHE
jgi:hypothetical protein